MQMKVFHWSHETHLVSRHPNSTICRCVRIRITSALPQAMSAVCGCCTPSRRGQAGMCLSVASTACSTSGATSASFPGHGSRSGGGPQPGCLQPAALHLLLRLGDRPGESLELNPVSDRPPETGSLSWAPPFVSLQPFVDRDHVLNSYFLPREYSLLLPAAAALTLLLFIGQYRSNSEPCRTVGGLLTSSCDFHHRNLHHSGHVEEPNSQESGLMSS